MNDTSKAISNDYRLTIVLFLLFALFMADYIEGRKAFLSAGDSTGNACGVRLSFFSSSRLRIENISDEQESAGKERSVPPILTPFFFQPIPINRADPDLLMTVNGIGRGLAESIVAYRRQFGPFANIDDLQNLRGIGPARLAKFATAFIFSQESDFSNN